MYADFDRQLETLMSTPAPPYDECSVRGHYGRRWDEHVPIALRVHTACTQYVRHWVEEPLTVCAPPLNGIGMLAFASKQDLEQRLFASREGVAEVAEDTARFVGERAVLFATEHVVLD